MSDTLPDPDLLAALPRLRRYARVLTGDINRADDLVQDTLTRAWAKRKLWHAGSDAKASGDWSVITRDDGSKQWAYKGKPLYSWAKDQKPGDMTGDGFNGIWHVVKD